MLNGLMVLVSDNNASTRVVAGVGACFVYLLVMNYFRPYKCASDFLLQNICHVQLFLTVLCGLLLKAEVPFLGFEPRWRPLEAYIIEVVIITSHVLTCVFAVGTVIWEKFFSSEVRRVQARRAKATLERKKRMAKWGRAKKAVLMGVRGSLGMKSFGGMSISGLAGNISSDNASEGSGVTGIIDALSKGNSSKTKVAPKKKVVLTEGFLASAKERAAAKTESNEESSSDTVKLGETSLSDGGMFAFPDDERDLDSSTGPDKLARLNSGLETSASEADETSAEDSDSSDDDNEPELTKNTETKAEVPAIDSDQSMDTDSSEDEDVLVTATQKNDRAKSSEKTADVGEKSDPPTTDTPPATEKKGGIADDPTSAPTPPHSKVEDPTENENKHQPDSPELLSGIENSNTSSGSSTPKLSVEEEMANIKEEAAIAAEASKTTEEAKTSSTNNKNKEKRTALELKGSGGTDFAWDDVSDSDDSSSSSVEDLSSDDE